MNCSTRHYMYWCNNNNNPSLYHMTDIYIYCICVCVCIQEKWEIFTVTAVILARWLTDTDALKQEFLLSKLLPQKDGKDMNASLKYTFA